MQKENLVNLCDAVILFFKLMKIVHSMGGKECKRFMKNVTNRGMDQKVINMDFFFGFY